MAIIPQPCDSVKCGPSAHCLGPAGLLSDEEQQTNQTLCVCNDGHIGDPYDEVHGCQSGESYKTKLTMEIGVWFKKGLFQFREIKICTFFYEILTWIISEFMVLLGEHLQHCRNIHYFNTPKLFTVL